MCHDTQPGLRKTTNLHPAPNAHELLGLAPLRAFVQRCRLGHLLSSNGPGRWSVFLRRDIRQGCEFKGELLLQRLLAVGKPFQWP